MYIIQMNHIKVYYTKSTVGILYKNILFNLVILHNNHLLYLLHFNYNFHIDNAKICAIIKVQRKKTTQTKGEMKNENNRNR